MFTLPDLPYDYGSLEPHIDEKTMKIHHDLHHGGYVKKLNAVLEPHPDLQEKPIKELLSDLNSIPEDIKQAVQNNGGGHFNHSLFWTVMKHKGGGEPKGELLDAINHYFGDFASFKKEFSKKASTRFGSGWAWLGVNENDELTVSSTPNQDNPLMNGIADCVCVPILGLDVWEHAYYLKYQNKRVDYIAAWWNIVNWDEVSRRFSEAIKR